LPARGSRAPQGERLPSFPDPIPRVRGFFPNHLLFAGPAPRQCKPPTSSGDLNRLCHMGFRVRRGLGGQKRLPNGGRLLLGRKGLPVVQFRPPQPVVPGQHRPDRPGRRT
jgi:hypothetical protein